MDDRIGSPPSSCAPRGYFPPAGPVLNLVDATEFIVSNGPMGPGELLRPHKVVAGTDRVAVDSYCAGLWGLKAAEIHTIRLAEEHGLGVLDLSGVKVREEALPG